MSCSPGTFCSALFLLPISVAINTQDIADIKAFTFDDLEQPTPGVSLFGGLTASYTF